MARIQAYGSDGEKALTDGFKRNFQFAFGLSCFIHFKKNIEKELSERIFNGLSKSDFILEIFGKQEGELKYSGLVDLKTGEEFDEKLSALKPKCDEREEVLKEGTLSFYDWFVRYKVRCHILLLCILLRNLLVGAGQGCNLNLYSIQFLVNFRCQIKIQNNGAEIFLAY